MIFASRRENITASDMSTDTDTGSISCLDHNTVLVIDALYRKLKSSRIKIHMIKPNRTPLGAYCERSPGRRADAP